MSASNIEKFNEITAVAFSILYREFPLPTVIKIKDLIGDAEVFVEDPRFGMRPTPENEFAYACMDWLVGAGYITGKTKPANFQTIPDCVLTAKGLEVLKAIPDALQEPLGDRLLDATKSGGKEMAKTVVNQILSTGVSLALKSVGLSD
ncbi:hypothetical protein [Pectobacterium sp. B1J-3]|uniref:hypothetical protein n=1 Tax=Pectobacterium sp. B1J-3 TaxID=3385371 RepID=UPI0039068231